MKHVTIGLNDFGQKKKKIFAQLFALMIAT